MDYYVQEENAFYGGHVLSLEHHMETIITQGQSLLQEEFQSQTTEVQQRAAAVETAYASGKSTASTMKRWKPNNMRITINSGESCKKP